VSDYFSYDEELPAGFQEADLLMAQYEQEAREMSALRRKGQCLHQSSLGYVSPAVYPEQEKMKPGQVLCREGCGKLFDSEQEMQNEIDYLLNGGGWE